MQKEAGLLGTERAGISLARHLDRRVTKRKKPTVSHIPSTQKLFTEDEVSRVTGICLDHLRKLAQLKHLGSLVRAAGAEAERWLFTNSELMILNVLSSRCDHEDPRLSA